MAPVSKDFATVYSALDWCETSLLNSCQGTYASDDEVGNTGWDDAMGPMLVRYDCKMVGDVSKSYCEQTKIT